MAKPLEQHLSSEELMLLGQKGGIKQQSFGCMVLVIKAQGITCSFNRMKRLNVYSVDMNSILYFFLDVVVWEPYIA